MDKLLLTPVEAAQALGIGRSKLYELMSAGVVPSVRIGGCRRIASSECRPRCWEWSLEDRAGCRSLTLHAALAFLHACRP